MTSKKRRQRGKRTRGGGTQKNRRGAGNRGGRGRAGRSKHEFHNYEPKGKHGFTRPPETRRSVTEVSLRSIDEDIALLAADGQVEETDDGYRVDARTLVDDDGADAVKVLATGRVTHELTVIADEFSENAVEAIEAAGGEAVVADGNEHENGD